MRQKNSVLSLFGPASTRAGCAVLGWLALTSPLHALEFELGDGEISGSLDTTLSYGSIWRVQGQARDLDGRYGININDGNRNYDTGLISQVYQMTSDFELNWRDYGLFLRATGFYDQLLRGETYYGLADWHTPQPSQSRILGRGDNRFTEQARDIAGRDVRLLDAYVYGSGEVRGIPWDVRVGNQVLSWGEGLFYRNGVNTTNPVDVAKFRQPGAGLKEALIPVETVSLGVGLSENLSADLFYQWHFRKNRLAPVGTFFSTTDLFAEGGHTAYVQGETGQYAAATNLHNALAQASVLSPSDYAQGDIFKAASIGPDHATRNSGQFGFALRYVTEALNDTEFGFYFVNYHDKVPLLRAELENGYGGAIQRAGGLSSFSGAIDTAAGLSSGTTQDALLALAAGRSPASLSPSQQAAVQAAAGVNAIDLGNHIIARRHYAEDIQTYGFSFSTTFGPTSFAGELAFRPDMPIAVSATNDLLGDALSQTLALATGQTASIAGRPFDYQQFRTINNSETVQLFNLSLSSSHSFGPLLSFDALFGVAEIASEYVAGSDLTYTAHNGEVRRFAGRGDCEYGRFQQNGGDGACSTDDQISRHAWGYTVALTGVWNDVYRGITLSPGLRWRQDVQGNSHLTGNFLEGSRSVTLGLAARYLDLSAEIQYTAFTGSAADRLRDRDNISFELQYSF